MRVLLGAALGALWAVYISPAVATRIEGARTTRAQPLRTDVVRRKIGMLPEPMRRQTVVRDLSLALDLDAALAKKEQVWNGIVAAQLTDPERARATAGARLDKPSPPPPAESPSSDGDILALARALLERYGWVPTTLPLPPELDPWQGADRRTRARGILSLVNGDGIAPDRAQVILAATLDFLDNGARRSANHEKIRALVRVSMGEVAAVQSIR